ncbi:MAG: type II secretion system F family protein, partial [Chlamydiales bacterium]
LAKERLLKQEMLLTRLAVHEKKEIILPKSLLLTFTRELAQLLQAGLPLYESLLTVEEKYRRQKQHPLFLDLCDRLKGGASLSSSLMRYPKSFDAVYLSLVKAGEESGSLPEIFEQLSLLITKQLRLRKLLISSMTYPMILLVFCMLVTAGLLFFVVPSLQELFEGRALHPLTQLVLNVSKWVNAHGLFLFIFCAGACFFLISLFRSEKGRVLIQGMSLKIPLAKTLLIRSALTRFCHCASLLTQSGVPLLDTLRLSRQTMKLKLLEDAIERAEKKIVEGKSLSQELKNSPMIPSLVIRMLSIAEETGRMGSIFHKLAEIYDEELEKNLTQLSAYLQPALLLTLGAVVGFVVLSILLPLTDVSSFLR